MKSILKSDHKCVLICSRETYNNDIDDKVIRGSLKKIYMAGKRNKLNSEDVINDMLEYLEQSDKKDDKLVKYLEGLI